MFKLLLNRVNLNAPLNALKKLPNNIQSVNRLCTKVAKNAENAGALNKDIIVFKYENPRFFKMVNVFAISQMFFWAYMGHWSYTSLRHVPTDPKKAEDDVIWWRKINLGEEKYKNIIGGSCFALGKIHYQSIAVKLIFL